MNNQSTKTKWEEEQQIIHHLMIKVPFLTNSGIMKGKMGIVILFYMLSKEKSQKVYADYAGELLDCILEELYNESVIDFASGLPGIIWGIEYLIQNKYIEGDCSDICNEVDNRIISLDPKRIHDTSLNKGLQGLLHYVLMHIQGCLMLNSQNPFDKAYLNDLYTNIKARLETSNDKCFISIAEKYREFIEKGNLNYQPSIKAFSKKIEHFDISKIDDYPSGIFNGLASLILLKSNT